MGNKTVKLEETYSVALTVIKITKTLNEDSYDKSTTFISKEQTQLASVDIAGADWGDLKAKLHSHIDLV